MNNKALIGIALLVLFMVVVAAGLAIHTSTNLNTTLSSGDRVNFHLPKGAFFQISSNDTICIYINGLGQRVNGTSILNDPSGGVVLENDQTHPVTVRLHEIGADQEEVVLIMISFLILLAGIYFISPYSRVR